MASGHANHKRMRGHITVHDGSRTNKCMLADGDSADDRAIGTEGSTPTNKSVTVFILANYGRAWVVDVRKHHAWSAEDIILERHVVVDGYVVLNLDVVADDDLVAHEHVLAQ